MTITSGATAPELAAGLIDAAGIHRGQRVLDVGCGPGPLTRALAARGAAVAAVDPSPEFVAACQARVPKADVRVGVAEELPFPSGGFDTTLAQLVVQLMNDREAGVAEMIRVTRPGGVVAACVWDSTTMPVLRAFWDAALAVAPDRAGKIDDGRRVGYESRDELGELWLSHGLVRGIDRRAVGERRVRQLRRPLPALHRGHGPLGGVLRVARPGRPATPSRGDTPSPGRA